MLARHIAAVFGMLLFILPNGAFAVMPTPAPSSPPESTGPCEDPALSSVAVRPGIGRAPATSGSVCVALPGTVVVGLGYRDQLTVGTGRQHLEVYPEPVALVGVAKRLELILAPGLANSRRTGVSGSSMLPATGQQDAGVGVQYLLHDRATLQQALALIATLPTGYPTGPSGFSVGAPSYALSYTVALNLDQSVALSTSQGFVTASAPILKV